MKKLMFITIMLLLSSCIAQDFPSVSAEEAIRMKAENDSLIFVDVRTEDEFNGPLGHIDGAILIPLHKLNDEISELDDYKDREIICYCRSGNRSQNGTRILQKNGFDAKNMLGGIRAWNKLKTD